MNNLNLFAVGSFEINSVTTGPITFNHGDKLQFTTTTLVSPTPSGLLELAKSDLEDKNNIHLMSRLIYESEYGMQKTLQLFITPINALGKSAAGDLYKVVTPFEIKTSELPSRKADGKNGFLRLKITWQVDQASGEVLNTVLPIYEKVR